MARTEMAENGWKGWFRRMMFEGDHKVAVATENGKVMASHFGSAPIFLVYEVSKGRIVDEELRLNILECSRSMEDTQARCWELMEQLLPDVRVVICRGMGENAYVGLLRRDVLPITTGEESVEKAIGDYLRGRLRDDPDRVHRPRRHQRCEDGDETIRIKITKGDAEELGDM